MLAVTHFVLFASVTLGAAKTDILEYTIDLDLGMQVFFYTY